jgi:hypothetical protein
MATVLEIIQYQQGVADLWKVQAQDFLNQLADLAGIDFEVDIPLELMFGTTDITDDMLATIDNRQPPRPPYPTLEPPPPLPDAPVVAFEDIDEELIEAVKVKLLYDLEHGGYGIEPDDEAALWQRARDRETQGAIAVDEEVVRQYAEGGFMIPPGSLYHARARALQAAADKISSVNRDIALKRADLYVQNRQFTIQQSIAAQNVLIALHRAITEHVTALIAIWNANVVRYKADLETQIAFIKANVDIYEADIRAFSVTISAISDSYKLMLEELRINNTWNIAVMQAHLEEAKVHLQAQKNEADVRVISAKAGSDFYAAAVSGAQNSIGTLAAQTTTSTS